MDSLGAHLHALVVHASMAMLNVMDPVDADNVCNKMTSLSAEVRPFTYSIECQIYALRSSAYGTL
ncbi:hypothetical protein HOLleu_31358 [Holothuria leucospilota]|uniref:Uncharacterized protein n=1 Tax=Holothuria leucospilota TaxID=206669 RepID=A0A9Q1BG79_HOLLE|nr:hypothetical protein HOLleu_31358 [Holothuria leucospilota]